MSIPPNTLQGWRTVISQQIPNLKRKSFAHNLISIALTAILKGWGDEAFNNAIEDFELDKKGWHKKEAG